jgi:hypothetical protein
MLKPPTATFISRYTLGIALASLVSLGTAQPARADRGPGFHHPFFFHNHFSFHNRFFLGFGFPGGLPRPLAGWARSRDCLTHARRRADGHNAPGAVRLSARYAVSQGP